MFLDCLSWAAGISQDLGDFEEAAELIKTLADLAPDEPFRWHCMVRSAQCAFELGRYEVALEAILFT
jgi:tetratricopeptide (TPR) repeat protein